MLMEVQPLTGKFFERCPLLKDASMLSPGDSIMVDRGFEVQDLLCTKNVFVNVPASMRNKNQLDPDTVERDRRIASKRVHVERLIGLAKNFKILKGNLNHNYVPIGGQILFVCFALSNFKESVVPMV